MHLKTEDVRSGYDEGGGCGGVLGAGWCFVAVKLYYSQKPRLCSDPPPTYNNNKYVVKHKSVKLSCCNAVCCRKVRGSSQYCEAQGKGRAKG